MYIIAFFADAGVPKTGLSPTITIRRVGDNQVLVNAQAMAEVGGGHYKYNYVAYDQTVDIAIVCDGTSTLSDIDRYKFAGNEDSYDGYIKLMKDNLDNPSQYQADVQSAMTSQGYTAARAAFIELAKKMLVNRLELADGSVDNWILYDDDDTPLLKFSITDKLGSNVVQPPLFPSRRSKGVTP